MPLYKGFVIRLAGNKNGALRFLYVSATGYRKFVMFYRKHYQGARSPFNKKKLTPHGNSYHAPHHQSELKRDYEDMHLP